MTTAERQAQRLQALAESSKLFAEATTDLTRLFEVVSRRFAELVGDAVNIRLIEGDELVPVATFHVDARINAFFAEYHDTTPLRADEGISGQVVATGEGATFGFSLPERGPR